MTSKSVLTVLTALLLAAAAGCDSKTASAPDKADEASQTAEAEKGEEGAEEPAEEPAEGEATSSESGEASDLPRGEAPDRAPLEAALAEMESEADETLFEGESCEGFKDLKKCRSDEEDEDWRTAAKCYRNFVVVGGPEECRTAQFVKAAANFERADSRQGAIASRMQVVKVGQKFTAAAVDAADYMIENGQIERARVFYNSYRTANPEGALVEYVDEQCERVDGCADQAYPPQK